MTLETKFNKGDKVRANIPYGMPIDAEIVKFCIESKKYIITDCEGHSFAVPYTSLSLSER